MKVIRVQYTVKESYVGQNKANIEKVMSDLRANPVDGFIYASY
jgi:hypothetical protein